MDDTYMLLRHACDTGDVERVRRLLNTAESGGAPALIGRRTWGDSPLHIACHLGDRGIPVVTEIIAAKPGLAALEELDDSKRSPLAIAAEARSLGLCELLIKAGVDPRRDTTALSDAIQSDSREIVELLLASGANTDRCLNVALEKNATKIAKILLAAGVKPTEVDLATAATFGEKMVRKLLELGAKPDKEGQALCNAANFYTRSGGHRCQKSVFNTIKLLLDAGAPTSGYNARYCLLKIVAEPFSETLFNCAQLLIDRGVDPGGEGRYCFSGTVIEAFCEHVYQENNWRFLELLIKKTRPSDICLMYAVGSLNVSNVALLARAGCRGDVLLEPKGRFASELRITALLLACRERRADMVKHMLDSGYTKLPKRKIKKSGLEGSWPDDCIMCIAATPGPVATEVLSKFLDRRPFIRDFEMSWCPGIGVMFPLHAAIASSCTANMELLISRGADINQMTTDYIHHDAGVKLSAFEVAVLAALSDTYTDRVHIEMAIRLARLGAVISPRIKEMITGIPDLARAVSGRELRPVAELLVAACNRGEGTVVELLDAFVIRDIIELCVNGDIDRRVHSIATSATELSIGGLNLRVTTHVVLYPAEWSGDVRIVQRAAELLSDAIFAVTGRTLQPMSDVAWIREVRRGTAESERLLMRAHAPLLVGHSREVAQIAFPLPQQQRKFTIEDDAGGAWVVKCSVNGQALMLQGVPENGIGPWLAVCWFAEQVLHLSLPLPPPPTKQQQQQQESTTVHSPVKITAMNETFLLSDSDVQRFRNLLQEALL